MTGNGNITPYRINQVGITNIQRSIGQYNSLGIKLSW